MDAETPERRPSDKRRKGDNSCDGMWNNSCSCDDLALGLIDKDMGRVTRQAQALGMIMPIHWRNALYFRFQEPGVFVAKRSIEDTHRVCLW